MDSQKRISISILIKALGEKKYRRMELGTFRQGNISIAVLDEARNSIHLEKDLQSNNQNSLTITLSDISHGLYFIEVDDGFFIQVKEIQI
ncbi:MAG: hypothetical protein AAF655_22970 [Bacteroidota bacterium]